MKRLLGLLILLTAVVGTAFYLNPPIQENLRSLGEFYLKNSYFGDYSAKSPEVVTSILWDYRGIDTLFETAVFFLAIIGSLTIFRMETKGKKTGETKNSLPLPVSVVTKFIATLILAISASIALHGQLTPGGGFQGGAALAVAPLLIIAAYSKYALENNGLDKTKAIILRSIGLLGIAIVAMIPLLLGGYIMQNQPIFSAEALGVPLGGSLVYYNIFEFLAVGAGFTAVFLLLAIPKEEFKEKGGACE
ncbi:MnhB domain-containing protein [Pyrococcus kukulkanii]|uniref:MnhB domain-containing protein n=1 Tax=Pyrococcus kukulkanii TaxID=1609559 RepID=UPI0035650480